MILLFTLLLSTYLTIALVPAFSRLSVRLNVLDQPNDRKVHAVPVPRTGGIAMALGTLAPIIIWASANSYLVAVLAGAGIITLFGAIDDFRELSAGVKFLGQFIAAYIAVFYGGIKITSLGTLLSGVPVLPDYAAIPLTFLFIVGVTNAINLSDGLDGLAGGLSLLTFICVAFLAYAGDRLSVSLLAVAVSGAIFGFLRFNTFPATLFMGDTGSQLLGFLSATLTLSLTQGNTPLSRLLPLILLGFPILDTLTVMLSRIVKGKSPFKADQNHFHHKLMKIGLFHKEAVLLIYIIQTFLVGVAYVFRFSSEIALLLFYMAFSGTILAGFYYAYKTGWRFRRIDLIDKVIKGKLRTLKDKGVLIKISFRVIEIVVPLLLLVTCIMPRSIPTFYALMSMGLLGVILLAWGLNYKWMVNVMGIALYLFIPFLIYLSETQTALWMNRHLLFTYHLAFWILVVFIYLTLKYTRRKNGFKITPMDFLILFIVIAIATLPDTHMQRYHIGMLTAKIIIFFMSYEVLIGELRIKVDRLCLTTALVLAVMSVRGFIG